MKSKFKTYLFKELEIGQTFVFKYEIAWQRDRNPEEYAELDSKHRVLPYIISFIKTGETSYKSLNVSKILIDNRSNKSRIIDSKQKGICHGSIPVLSLE